MRKVDPGDGVNTADAKKVKDWTEGLALLQAAEAVANKELDIARKGHAGSYDEVYDALDGERQRIATELAQATTGEPSRLARAVAAAGDAETLAKIAVARLSALEAALRIASVALLGKVETDVPLLMLPVRLETRFERSQPDAAPQALKIRIYPDDIHVDSHQPALTDDERNWGSAYWNRRGATGSDLDKAAWRQLAMRFGARRAAWIALTTDPTAPIGLQGDSRKGRWTKAAQADLLPDAWIALACSGDEVMSVAMSAPVAKPLAMSPSPENAAPGTTNVDGVPAVDDGMRWMVDFDAAMKSGMAIRLPFAARPELAVRGIDRLFVIGVLHSKDAAQTGVALGTLFNAHRYTSGLRMLPMGSPTNNTEAASAGASTAKTNAADDTDVEAVYALERGAPQWAGAVIPPIGADRLDGHWLAWGLGLGADAFARIADSTGRQLTDGIAALGAVVPQAQSALLDRLGLGRVRPQSGQPLACAGGLLPSFRIGTQPYAVAPVMAFDDALNAGSNGAAADAWRSPGHALRAEVRRRAIRGASFRQGADITALISQTGAGSTFYRVTVPDAADTGEAQAVAATDLFARFAWPAGIGATQQRDAIDALARRPDVWIGAETSQRLAMLRDARPTGLRLGGWGYVENLRPTRIEAANHGFIQTPSLAHAATAAILRSGYEAKNPVAAVNLSSERVQRARWLLDGARNGQPLGALLGYRFERRLREARPPLAQFTARFRTLAAMRREDAVAKALAAVATAQALLDAAEAPWLEKRKAVKALDDLKPIRSEADGRLRPFQATVALGGQADQTLAAARTDLANAQAASAAHVADAPVGESDYEADRKPPVKITAVDPGEYQAWSAEQARLDGVVAAQQLAVTAAQTQVDALAPTVAAAKFNLSDAGPAGKAYAEVDAAWNAANLAIPADPRPTDPQKAALSQAREKLVAAIEKQWSEATSTSVAYQGVDGLELHRRWRRAVETAQGGPVWTAETIPFGNTTLGFPADGSTEFAGLIAQLRILADEVDSIADLSVAEGVFQLVHGNPARAAGALDVLSAAGGVPPAEHEVVRTPRSGTAITHRIVSLLPTKTPAPLLASPPGWPISDAAVRAMAEPTLEACAAALLPAPDRIVCGMTSKSAGHAAVAGSVDATLLDFSALDFIACAAASTDFVGDASGNELIQRLDYQYRRSHPEVALDTLLDWMPQAAADPAQNQINLADAIELAASVHALLASARAIDSRDLGGSEAALDLDELALRVEQVYAATIQLSAAIDLLVGDPKKPRTDVSVDTWLPLLLRATCWRIGGALPVSPMAYAGAAGTTPIDSDVQAAHLIGIALQAAKVASELHMRLERYDTLATSARAGSPTIDGLQAQVRCLLGYDCLVLATIKKTAAIGQWRDSMAAPTDLLGADASPLACSTWLRRIAFVRDGASRLQRVLVYTDALAINSTAALSPGQSPWSAGERWVSLPPPAGLRTPRGRVSVLAHLPFGKTPDEFRGLVHDEWVEVIPSGQDLFAWPGDMQAIGNEVTGVAFHYDAPNAAAPNVALLAIARDDAVWHLDLLQRTVLAAVESAKARSAPDDGSTEFVWFADDLPHGAVPALTAADSAWAWSAVHPRPSYGRRSHRYPSTRDDSMSGFRRHAFSAAGPGFRLAIESGDMLFVDVCLAAGSDPKALIVQWACSTAAGDDWEHRAVWCDRSVFEATEPWASQFPFGTRGQASRRWAGTLPNPGGWVRLAVPAREVGLEGREISGMSFGVIDGGAAWGACGKVVGSTSAKSWIHMRNDEIWFAERAPEGAALQSDAPGGWQWVAESPAPFAAPTTTRSSQVSALGAGLHQHGFTGASKGMLVGPNDLLFAHVYIDASTAPKVLMLQWSVGGNSEHRAFWGAKDTRPAGFGAGTLGGPGLHWTAEAPAADALGRWLRLEVPADAVGLANSVVDGVAFILVDGSAAWGPIGVSRPTIASTLTF